MAGKDGAGAVSARGSSASSALGIFILLSLVSSNKLTTKSGRNDLG